MLSHMDEVLGTRYCEPTAMKANMIMTRAMQLIMKGTFNRADLAGRGRTGTRWQMLDELVESCSAEDVGKLQDARGAPSGPASSMISTPRQRQAWRRLPPASFETTRPDLASFETGFKKDHFSAPDRILKILAGRECS